MRGSRAVIFWSVLFAGLFLLRVSFLGISSAPGILDFVGEEVVVVGTVVNSPERRETSLHAYIEIERVGKEKSDGVVLLMLPREAELFYGNRVAVLGEITLPEAFETETGRVFDYPGYLRARGVSALMRYAELQERVAGRMSIKKFLFELKYSFSSSLERMLPEPQASLMEGILLGERRGIPKGLTDAFVLSGLIHIVVLSGYNVALVADNILRFFSLFLPRSAALLSGAVGILLFAIMTGAGATTVRATTMGLIAILARYLERPALALRALLLAGALMALWNPYSVVDDPSFILSMLATFGLITLSPAVEARLGFLNERFGLRAIAASTIAVQAFVLPALLYMTGILSLFALPANILVLPVIGLTMFAGFLAGLLGIIHIVLALPFVALSEVLLRWIMFVAQTTEHLPLSGVVVPPFPLFLTILVYVPLTLFALKLYQNETRRRSS